MERTDVPELHYITSMTNVPSMLERGLLSNVRAAAFQHESVADPDVQELRNIRRTPAGRPIHEYANLYVNGRNAMLNKRARAGGYLRICVLRVDSAVLDLPGVFVTDKNAATLARYGVGADGLSLLNRDEVMALNWDHADPSRKYSHRQIMMAEVLVPDLVPPEYIVGAYVANSAARTTLRALAPGLAIEISVHMFFGMAPQ